MRKSHFSSLRVLLLTQVGIAVLPVLVLTIYIGISQMRSAQVVAQERAVRVATQAASIQRWMLEAARRQLQAIAEVDVLLDTDEAKRGAFFAEQQRGRILVSNLGLADLHGQVMHSSKSLEQPVSLANEEWFQRVLKTRQPAEGQYQLSPVSREPVMPLATPVFNDKGEVYAVVFAGLNVSWLQEMAADADLPEGATVTLLGHGGKSMLGFPLGKMPVPDDVRKWAQGLNIADTWHRESEFYGCAPLFLGDKSIAGWVVIGFPEASTYKQVRRNIVIQVGTLLLVGELLMLLVIIGSRRFLIRPIQTLSEITKRFAAGDLGARVGLLHGAKELEELGQSFNQMAETLRQQNSILELSEERFRQVVEASPVGMHFWHLDGDGQLLLTGFNPSAVDLLGMDHEPLLGQPLQEAFPFYAGTDIPDRYREVCAVGIPWHWEEVQSTNDRLHRAFEVTAFRTTPGNMVVMFSDVSERRQTLEALRESERRFRQFFENSPDAVFVESPAGIVLDVNNAACALHGLHREQLIGKHVTDLVPEERREQVMRDFPRVASGEWTNFESFSYTASGHAVPVEISAARIDYSGEPSILLHVRDISSRKQSQIALLESEARFRNLSEATFEGVALTDAGRILDANTRLVDMTGYRLTELIGHSLTDLAVPDIRQILAAHLAGSNKPIEYTAQRKDGATFPAEARSQTLPYKGKLVRVTAIRDMTEQKRTQETMQRLVAAVEQTVEGIVVTDPSGVILYVNPAFTHITGYTRDEAIGATSRILKSGKHDEAFYRDLWETITRGDVWRGFFFNRKKDGTIFQEEDTITPIKDPQGRVTAFVAVKRDVTREVNLELQLLQSQKMEAVGRLAGGVAHDFNNILTAITGYGELSLRKLQPTDTLHRHVQEILKAAGRATTLTRQLLAFSRKQVLEPHIFELNELITNLQGMLHRLIGANIELITDLEPNTPWPIKSNPGQMEQVIVNMVVNAHDAMPTGGKLTIRTRNITVEKDFAELHVGVPRGDCVLLSITDTGAGMTDETKAHLFEPFFTTKGRDKGTGLGLATCYGIVKQTGGHIVVSSKIGEGTTFDIFLPRASETGTPVPTALIPTGLTEEVPRSRGNETVLLVEDEEAVRELIHMVMTELGYTVWIATNGVDALRLIHEKSPHRMDILFTDVIMPQMGGRELAERLRATDPNLKVIFCTGYTAEADWITSSLSPITQFIQKPFTPLKLGRTLREVLDAKPTP